MSHQAVLQLLSAALLICIGIVVVIDMATEFGLKAASQLKWSLVWYGARYVAIVCAILLALDVLT